MLGGIAAAVADSDAIDAWHPTLRDWARASPTPPDEIIESTKTLLGLDDDPLAALYNAAISASNRRRLGTVFTPPALVEHMLQLAEAELEAPPSLVIDPGAGVGAFTIAAARTWPDTRIVAVDINPVTLGLLAARLAFEADVDPDRADSYRRVGLRLGSYLDEIKNLYDNAEDRPILALGNPPYTRVQELPTEDRAKAAALAGDLIDSGHANLAMLFQAATIRHMRPQDVSCMVLPGSLSFTRASRALRTALWESPRSVTVHRTPAIDKVFIGRSVQAAILVAGSERQRRSKMKLARVALADRAVEVIEEWKLSRTEAQPDNWFVSTPMEACEASEVALGDFAIVRRGVATGANEMFFLTDAIAATLPNDVVVPAIPTLREFDEDDLTSKLHLSFGDSESTRRWLLAIPPGRSLDGPLAEYVARFQAEVAGRHLPSQRTPWYAINELPRPQILFSPLSKTTFKVVVNSAGAVPSNNLFGVSLKAGAVTEPLVAWLRSDRGQAELRRSSRRYPGGSHKLEPGDLRNIAVPDYVVAATHPDGLALQLKL